MSNHSGSYMLNKVLKVLEREAVFELLGETKTQAIVREIIRIATYQYDCNSGEILEESGSHLTLISH